MNKSVVDKRLLRLKSRMKRFKSSFSTSAIKEKALSYFDISLKNIKKNKQL